MLLNVPGPERPITMVSGKGGVGKTTVAAALAAGMALAGHRTVLVSTDPAHSTGDLMGALADGPPEVADRLEVVEIDAEVEADRYVEAVRRDVHRLVDPAVHATVDRHLDLARRGAGTLESAMLDRLGRVLASCPSEHDRVVVDTAPTGHTLRLLAMPELVTGWIEGLVRQRERVRGSERMMRNLAGEEPDTDDPVLDRLRAQRTHLVTLRRRLRDDTVLHTVAIPERLPIEEVVRSLPGFESAGMTVGAVVVNRVLPAAADGIFLAARREQQTAYLDELRRRLTGRWLVEVAQQRRDVTGWPGLDAVRADLAPLLGD